MTDYSQAGVSIDSGDMFVNAIKDLCKTTYSTDVVGDIGGFCSLYRLPSNSNLLLCSSTDGVGTKLLLANQYAQFGFLSSIVADLIAMVVNDILTCGAMPLFFLDYYGLGRLNQYNNFLKSRQVIKGIANGCKEAECSLIGGELSEMPDMYDQGKFDLVGFGVGVIEEQNLLGQHRVKNGDHIIGIASSGFHSNGYSLIRHVYQNLDWNKDSTLINDLLTPTTIYVKLIKSLLTVDHKIHAMAHITGGGLEHNTSRVVPDNLTLKIDWSAWTRPKVFDMLQYAGSIEEHEMRRVFNCGIGFTLIVDETVSSDIVERIKLLGYNAWNIGLIKEKS